jgi:hypothetical protein
MLCRFAMTEHATALMRCYQFLGNSMALQPSVGPRSLFQFLDFFFTQSVWLLDEWAVRRKAGTWTEYSTNTLNKRAQTFMPLVGFEPTIPVGSKTVHALGRAGTVFGCWNIYNSVTRGDFAVKFFHFPASLRSKHDPELLSWYSDELWIERSGSTSAAARYFPDRLLGPPSFLPNGYRGALSPEFKRPGRDEADHPSSSSDEFQEWWSYTSIPPYVFMGWCLIN